MCFAPISLSFTLSFDHAHTFCRWWFRNSPPKFSIKCRWFCKRLASNKTNFKVIVSLLLAKALNNMSIIIVTLFLFKNQQLSQWQIKDMHAIISKRIFISNAKLQVILLIKILAMKNVLTVKSFSWSYRSAPFHGSLLGDIKM